MNVYLLPSLSSDVFNLFILIGGRHILRLFSFIFPFLQIVIMSVNITIVPSNWKINHETTNVNLTFSCLTNIMLYKEQRKLKLVYLSLTPAQDQIFTCVSRTTCSKHYYTLITQNTTSLPPFHQPWHNMFAQTFPIHKKKTSTFYFNGNTLLHWKWHH